MWTKVSDMYNAFSGDYIVTALYMSANKETILKQKRNVSIYFLR